MPVGWLLIVDDETALLDLLKRYLERAGYQVHLASTPEEALACFERDPEKFACVLTDLTLPGMDGEQLIERMRVHNPRLPALISSGYPYSPRAAATVFLQKPYLPKMLVEALEGLLRSGQ
jgi:DNA-binding NtrC family response regulator